MGGERFYDRRVPRLVLAALVGVLAVWGGCDSGAEPETGSSQAAQGFEPVRTVHRVAEGNEETDTERAEAVRIIDQDPLLAPLIEDGGGYSLSVRNTGPINGPGRHRFIGVATIIRLQEPVTGIYDFPVICIGLKNQRLRLSPISYEVHEKRSFYVDTGFHSGQVIQASPVGDGYDLAPGASVPEAPTTCERRSRRDVGE